MVGATVPFVAERFDEIAQIIKPRKRRRLSEQQRAAAQKVPGHQGRNGPERSTSALSDGPGMRPGGGDGVIGRLGAGSRVYGTVSSTLVALPKKIRNAVYQHTSGPLRDHSCDDGSVLLRQVLRATTHQTWSWSRSTWTSISGWTWISKPS